MTTADVTAGLHALGITAGETVFFHSSLKSMGQVTAPGLHDHMGIGGADLAPQVTGGPEGVVGGFLEAVGSTGTVVVPTFTLTERRGPFGSWYDHETTPSTVGLITETLRRRPDAMRSFHPVHSVAAVGRLARMVTAQQRNTFGRRSPWCDAGFAQGSPFDLLTRWNAWYVLLGVEFQVQTIMHYLETILVDAVLRRASVADREALRTQVSRWGAPGIWPAPERMPLGAMLAADGTYRHATIGPADVYGSRFQAVLGRALEIVLGAPETWLDEAFRDWMGSPLDPVAVLEEYVAPGGGAPLAAPALAISCVGLARPRS